MMRSMLADQPYLDVTTEHGVVTSLLEIFTDSTSSAGRTSFHQRVKSLNCSLSFLLRAFSLSSVSPNLRSSLDALLNLNSSNSVRFCIVYSSIGSVK